MIIRTVLPRHQQRRHGDESAAKPEIIRILKKIKQEAKQKRLRPSRKRLVDK